MINLIGMPKLLSYPQIKALDEHPTIEWLGLNLTLILQEVCLMKRLLFVVLVTNLCLVNLGFAQKTEVGPGAKAISFTLTGLDNLGLGTIEGGMGVKYWLSTNLAVQPIVNFDLGSATRKSTDPDYTDNKRTTLSLGLTANLEWHWPLSNKISPYLGAKAGYRSSALTDELSIRKQNPPPGTTKEMKTTSSSFVVGGLVGAEFFIRDNISLAGHYQFNFNSISTTEKHTLVAGTGVTQPPEEKTSSTDLRFSTTSIILNIYF
ncbi:MAG: PorT family protein [candidate division KSB1 bacterium]|nr:PorT family protein [candidate division KSB1 bacterium]